MRADSAWNLSAEADPNPARKTRVRVLKMCKPLSDFITDIDLNEEGMVLRKYLKKGIVIALTTAVIFSTGCGAGNTTTETTTETTTVF